MARVVFGEGASTPVAPSQLRANGSAERRVKSARGRNSHK